MDPARLTSLRQWARNRGLLLELEKHPRLLALLNQPQLALLMVAAGNGQLSAADLAGPLMELARWPQTRTVGLLLAPDAQRKGHPSVDLEADRRPLSDLRPMVGSTEEGVESPTCPLLNLTPGAFIVWRAGLEDQARGGNGQEDAVLSGSGPGISREGISREPSRI